MKIPRRSYKVSSSLAYDGRTDGLLRVEQMFANEKVCLMVPYIYI